MNFAALRSDHHSEVSREVKKPLVRTLSRSAVKMILWALDTFQIDRRAAKVHIITEVMALSPNEPMVSINILVRVRCLICGRFELVESVAENKDTDVC